MWRRESVILHFPIKAFIAFCQSAKDIKEQVEFFKYLTKEGHLRAIIDRQYTLEKVAEANRYVEKGMKVGSISIKVV